METKNVQHRKCKRKTFKLILLNLQNKNWLLSKEIILNNIFTNSYRFSKISRHIVFKGAVGDTVQSIKSQIFSIGFKSGDRGSESKQLMLWSFERRIVTWEIWSLVFSVEKQPPLCSKETES